MYCKRGAIAALMLLIAPLIPAVIAANSNTWTFEELEDPMTGRIHAVAHSPISSPLSKPNFPYDDVSSRIDFRCSRFWESEQVEFRFTALNIPTRSFFKEGVHQYVITDAKWDDERGFILFYPSTEFPELHVIEDEHETTVESLMGHDELLIEVPFYGTGAVYFRYSLEGSSVAIASEASPQTDEACDPKSNILILLAILVYAT